MFSSSLRSRFVVLIGLALTVTGLIGYQFVLWYGETSSNALGIGYAERAALYEKSQIINILVREITLAQKMSSSPALRNWLADEENAQKNGEVFAEMEDYRKFFRSKSYFLTVAKSGNYYYNDEKGGHAIGTPRYSLDRTIQKDGWFYTLLESGEPKRLNVDTDRGIGVTNVWVNFVVRDNAGKAIAVTGTGIDLSEFIRDVISSKQTGITNAFIDSGGAIQAYPDVSIIDFASVRKEASKEEQSTIFSLIDSPDDGARLHDAMAALSSGQADVKTLKVSVQHRHQFVGIAYVPEIKWFVVTLIDLRLVAHDPVTPVVGTALVSVLLVMLLLVAAAVDFFVLRRLSRLAAAVQSIGEGRYDTAISDASHDEIGQLASTLRHVAARIAAHTDDLECQVQERTLELVAANAQLETLAATDPLTGAWNRRRLEDAVISEMDRLRRYAHPLSMLIIDIDYFKAINDDYGHAVGDQVLVELTAVVREILRASDSLARWGGEEFVVLCPNTTLSTAAMLAERLRAKIGAARFPMDRSLTVSIGVAECMTGETWDQWFQRADVALYRAKIEGRNQVQVALEMPRCVNVSENISTGLVRLTWRAAYGCGHPLIDSQHRGLFDHANTLIQAVLDGRPSDELSEKADALIRDVAQHFQDEEAIIRKAGFPGAEQHAAIHRNLLDGAAVLIAEMNSGTLGIGELFEFLAGEVITRHMLGTDREFFRYLVSQ